jgi:hypothetical protein
MRASNAIAFARPAEREGFYFRAGHNDHTVGALYKSSPDGPQTAEVIPLKPNPRGR